MNKTLLQNIKTQLTATLSGSTKHIYYYHLPNKELLKQFTVTYEVQNTGNEKTFEDKEAVKYYSLRVNLNSPTLSDLENKSIYLSNSLYDLKAINPKIKNIVQVDEQNFWDDELNIWTEYLNYEIHYS